MTDANILRLRADAIDAADLHAKWLRDRSISPGSTLSKVLDPLITEYLRGRAHVAAQRYEEASR